MTLATGRCWVKIGRHEVHPVQCLARMAFVLRRRLQALTTAYHSTFACIVRDPVRLAEYRHPHARSRWERVGYGSICHCPSTLATCTYPAGGGPLAKQMNPRHYTSCASEHSYVSHKIGSTQKPQGRLSRHNPRGNPNLEIRLDT